MTIKIEQKTQTRTKLNKKILKLSPTLDKQILNKKMTDISQKQHHSLPPRKLSQALPVARGVHPVARQPGRHPVGVAPGLRVGTRLRRNVAPHPLTKEHHRTMVGICYTYIHTYMYMCIYIYMFNCQAMVGNLYIFFVF